MGTYANRRGNILLRYLFLAQPGTRHELDAREATFCAIELISESALIRPSLIQGVTLTN
jgi:hypothetical protein